MSGGQRFVLTEAERAQLAEYLAQRPWREANPLMAILVALPKAPPVPPELAGEPPE